MKEGDFGSDKEEMRMCRGEDCGLLMATRWQQRASAVGGVVRMLDVEVVCGVSLRWIIVLCYSL